MDPEMEALIKELTADFKAKSIEFVTSGDVSIRHMEDFLGPVVDGHCARLLETARRIHGKPETEDEPSQDRDGTKED